MTPKTRWMAALTATILLAATVITWASPPIFTEEVTDYGRNRWRTHYTPSEPEYPMSRNARPIWEVPLGLSRSQPLVVNRDVNGDGKPDVRVFHIAGDRLWALNGDMIPPARQPGQSVEAYRQQLVDRGFILWSTPADALCATPALRSSDELLDMKCAALGPRAEARPFSSSQAAYWKGATPDQDIIYVGFGHPASVVAIRAKDGKMLGGYIIDQNGDRGIVGAPLVFAGDTVVVGTTSGEAYIVQGLASGNARVRGLSIGGRISYSPMPLGESAFIMASDAREGRGYMMAYSLGSQAVRAFAPKWPAAVQTPAGIPGEAAIDAQTIYFADKFGRLYALRLENGELLWCRQYPDMGPCRDGGDPAPAFINNGPGVDEDRVYFVYRNSDGPNSGNGYVVALNKATGDLVWEQPMSFKGNTAPVPMAHLVLVGDTGGYVRAYDKYTGEPVTTGGYPLQLSTEPYREGMQGERWWEPIGGTATQMTVAAGLMLAGVNSTSEDRTVLRAFKLYRVPDLTLEYLDTPASSEAAGFAARVRAVCHGCVDPITTTVSISINGYELPRQAVTFRPEAGWAANLSWQSGPQEDGARVHVVATVDPDNDIDEADETNNQLDTWVQIQVPVGPDGEGHYGSILTD